MLTQSAIPAFSQRRTPRTGPVPAPIVLDPAAPGHPLEAGVSGAWRRLLAQAAMAAPHMKLASIEGEPGSGKQTLARYLWSISPLADSRFERHDAREWLLVADPASLTGFVYLDRVDLLASPGQGLLLGALKTLQERPASRYMIIASSQASLRQMAGQGVMLPDLAFRLAAVRFAIPPLRSRKEDLIPLSHHLLEQICARYQHKPVALAPAALNRLLQHDWPGNVGELASVLEAALLESDQDLIRPGDLPLDRNVTTGHPGAAPSESPERLLLDDCIHRHVQYVLDLNRGNKLRAARQLGISRSTLYRILSSESILTPAGRDGITPPPRG
jgi:DNA-binding NtrC family response regulator